VAIDYSSILAEGEGSLFDACPPRSYWDGDCLESSSQLRKTSMSPYRSCEPLATSALVQVSRHVVTDLTDMRKVVQSARPKGVQFVACSTSVPFSHGSSLAGTSTRISPHLGAYGARRVDYSVLEYSFLLLRPVNQLQTSS
jgi:hypothetical protein